MCVPCRRRKVSAGNGGKISSEKERPLIAKHVFWERRKNEVSCASPGIDMCFLSWDGKQGAQITAGSVPLWAP
jgi:hypothetical protein